ncbi:GNAT family protein [Kineosporia mesophila]|uniref:GNAT family protein n=1 Tax=Kineosporia mesophila TaxID=566012 RepID=A0ABP6Z6V3_9ACTN|nr:GNAT family protein [Kineosporia mesophila]MCD5354816.1 GNAT family N-acetyltransferase [Kineosporia mesophila]
MTDVELRQIFEDDVRVYAEIFASAEGTSEYQWFGFRDIRKFVRDWEETGMLTDDRGSLLVVADQERAGFVDWHRVRTAKDSWCWNVGIALLPGCRGRGIGTGAQELLVRYLFDHTAVQRIEAGTDVENIAEQRALEKAGFQREGVMRGHYFRMGAWHDTVLYSVLRDDLTA